MSIREDARNARLVKETLGYDPDVIIARLRREIVELNKRISYLSSRNNNPGYRDNY